MAASLITKLALPRPGKRSGVLLAIAPIALLIATSWWLTADLTDSPSGFPTQDRKEGTTVIPVQPEPRLSWPETRLEGMPAKKLLLSTLLDAGKRLDEIE